MLKRCSVLLVATLLAACGGATTFDQFSLEEGLSARMDASQRVVLVSNRGGKNGNRHVVCAEPSPDSIISASAVLATKLERESTDPESRLLGSASAQATLATAQNAAFVGMRTQTIQLLRDGLYRACEAYMNGAIDEMEYNMLLVNMPKVMTALIAIDGLTARPAAPAVVVGAPNTSIQPNGTVQASGNISQTVILPANGASGAGEGAGKDDAAKAEAAKAEAAKAAVQPASVTNTPGTTLVVVPSAPNVSETSARAVYGISQAVLQTSTMPAVCMSLLHNQGQDNYRSDDAYMALLHYCQRIFDNDTGRRAAMLQPVPALPKVPGEPPKTRRAAAPKSNCKTDVPATNPCQTTQQPQPQQQPDAANNCQQPGQPAQPQQQQPSAPACPPPAKDQKKV